MAQETLTTSFEPFFVLLIVWHCICHLHLLFLSCSCCPPCCVPLPLLSLLCHVVVCAHPHPHCCHGISVVVLVITFLVVSLHPLVPIVVVVVVVVACPLIVSVGVILSHYFCCHGFLLESCKQGCGLESENAQVSEKTNGTWLQLVRSCALSTVL